MAKVRSWAGLDVHARSVLAASMDSGTGELRVRKLSGETSEVVDFCASLPGPTRVAYEAGPTGYGLARALLAAGVECVVAAPGKIERPAQDRVKTDQRDAERVLRLLMIDALHAVRVPSNEEEALRDLVRAREALRGDLMRARQRMGKLLLRHDIRYEQNASTWTRSHRAWLAKVRLDQRGAQATLLDYLGAIDALEIRRDALEVTLSELVADSAWAPTVARLRCLRGIDTLSAVGLCAEVGGDFHRFGRPKLLMRRPVSTPLGILDRGHIPRSPLATPSRRWRAAHTARVRARPAARPAQNGTRRPPQRRRAAETATATATATA